MNTNEECVCVDEIYALRDTIEKMKKDADTVDAIGMHELAERARDLIRVSKVTLLMKEEYYRATYDPEYTR